MRLELSSIHLDDQAKAHRFYTEVFGAAEHRRLVDAGVELTMDPTPQGPVTLAVFADTCGNLIQIYQPTG